MSDDLQYLEATAEQLSATVALEPAMNYALAHNGVSPLRRLIIRNDSDQPVQLTLEVELTGPVPGRIAQPLRLVMPEVAPLDELRIDGPRVRWEFDPATFAQIDEANPPTKSARNT